MKVYRNLKPDETLQAGDERFWVGNCEWIAIGESVVGRSVPEDCWQYRRPVDSPVLQRVTPEAVSELEQREAWVILFRHKQVQWNRYARATYNKFGRCWINSNGNAIDPLDFYWFIVPDTIPEVQQ
mgnify:CR=1 FL=1